MRLETGLFTSREGILSHGIAMAVVGDNLANANTVGFKSSRVEFESLLGEGFDGRDSDSLPDGAGNGVAISTIRQIQELGAIEQTNRALDVGIDGSGFFVVGDSAAPLYTRAGNFGISTDGFLVNSEGSNVLGFAPADTTGATLSSLDLLNVQVDATPSTISSIVGNIDSSSAITTPPTNPATFSELSQAASFVADLLAIDSLGASHNLKIAFFKTATNTWTAQSYIDGGEVGGTVGVPSKIGNDATLAFGNTGVIADASAAGATLTLTPAYSNGAAAGNLSVDLSSFTQRAASSVVSSITDNGKGTGTIKEYKIETDGQISAILSSGETISVGRIALAKFPNIDGLEKVGNNAYRAKESAGDVTSSFADSNGLGKLRGNALERSTVDIAAQFTDLILYQRGYQSNSQVMSAVNELLQQTLGLIR